MRVSIDERDPGYNHKALLDVDGVMLDGRRLPRASCITADEEAGKVLMYVLGEDGKPMRDPTRPERPFVMKVVEGHVRIIWRT